MATQAAFSAKVMEPNRALVRSAWAVVGYNVLVVLWGAVVRATGSGNGCGEHWPLCGGTVAQHWRTVASVIEFAHRASAGVDAVAILALLVWTWRATVPRHLARATMVAAALFTFTEGLLGALLVLLGLTGQSRSPLRAPYLALHLANTLLLLAALALTAHFLSRRDARMRGGVMLAFRTSAGFALGAVMLVGMTGASAALADTLYPAPTLRAAFAQDLAPGAPLLLHLRWIHPALSLLAAAAIVLLLVQPLRVGLAVRGARAVAGLLALQMVLGIADVLLLAPTALQVAHLCAADLLWISLVVFAARLCVRPAGCTAALCGIGGAPTVRATRENPVIMNAGKGRC